LVGWFGQQGQTSQAIFLKLMFWHYLFDLQNFPLPRYLPTLQLSLGRKCSHRVCDSSALGGDRTALNDPNVKFCCLKQAFFRDKNVLSTLRVDPIKGATLGK